MKNLRAFLWIGLALILFVNYETWMADYAPRDAAVAAAARQQAEREKSAHPLAAEVPQAPAANGSPAPATGAAPAAAQGTAPAAASNALTPGATLNVRTDVLDVDINLRGGELTRADLLQYPVVKGGSEPVRLLRNLGAGNQYLVQTGLAGAGGAGDYPTHLALFTSDYTGLRLEQGLDELRVPLKWSADGITVTKTYIFRRGSYRVDVEYEVMNAGTTPWTVAPYAQIEHDMPLVKRTYLNVDSYSFTGPAIYDGSKYQKLRVTNDKDAAFKGSFRDGWIASLQHHFVVAIVPPRDELQDYSLAVRGNEYLATDLGQTTTVAPASNATLHQTLFIGPKLQHQLAAIHPELGRAADFGKLTFLARPLFWLLEQAHKVFNNWGLAIIAVTFLLKLAFYPLSEIAGRSAAKMKLIAPRMKQLQETYKDDRTRLGQATMELYKKEKINPAAGCLPMLIQIPVFMAFYWVLVESVEMRQAPFMGWLHDLSSRDPFYILPVLMAGAMFLQYKMQPPTADPTQAKVMMIMPIGMSVLFAFLPSGLVLYYLTNTLLTIAQQWNINRRIQAASPARN
ncbi:MAG TPA: membrane protein insertase YidC [Steroidobacteraceae bacterium]|nr:membrane protein insertase YidC [Steroidobacteraceae bacterium]